VSWIAIANREINLFRGLEARIHSRMSVEVWVTFGQYDDKTITEILASGVAWSVSMQKYGRIPSKEEIARPVLEKHR